VSGDLVSSTSNGNAAQNTITEATAKVQEMMGGLVGHVSDQTEVVSRVAKRIRTAAGSDTDVVRLDTLERTLADLRQLVITRFEQLHGMYTAKEHSLQMEVTIAQQAAVIANQKAELLAKENELLKLKLDNASSNSIQTATPNHDPFPPLTYAAQVSATPAVPSSTPSPIGRNPTPRHNGYHANYAAQTSRRQNVSHDAILEKVPEGRKVGFKKLLENCTKRQNTATRFPGEHDKAVRLMYVHGLSWMPLKQARQLFYESRFVMSKIYNIAWVGKTHLELLIDESYVESFTKSIDLTNGVLTLMKEFDPRMHGRDPSPEKQKEAAERFASRAASVIHNSMNTTTVNFFKAFVNGSSTRIQTLVSRKLVELQSNPSNPDSASPIDADVAQGLQSSASAENVDSLPKVVPAVQTDPLHLTDHPHQTHSEAEDTPAMDLDHDDPLVDLAMNQNNDSSAL
jgi:hypothetical protein